MPDFQQHISNYIAILHEKLSRFKILSLLVGGGFYFTILAISLQVLVVNGFIGTIPEDDEISQITNPLAAEVYSVDRVLLGKYYLEDRTDIEFDSISPFAIQALVATEDVRFYEHDGVDLKSLIRVVVKTILLQKESAGGGSTITQQLAKNLFPRQDFGILSLPINKIREAEIAQRIEGYYSKEEILSLYLNTVSFGENTFGIETAARRFFGKSTSKLKDEEAAVLIGILKASTSYNPRLYPEKSKIRRNVVLSQMMKYGYISEEERDSLAAIPLNINYSITTHNTGLAPYFREFLRKDLSFWCKNTFKPDGSNYNLYTDGLKIYTTIHSKMQEYAEASVESQLARLQKSFDNHWKRRDKIKATGTLIEESKKASKRWKSLKNQGFTDVEADSIFQIPVEMALFSWDGIEKIELSPLDSIIRSEFTLHSGFLAVDPTNGHVRAWVGGINHEHFQFDHVTCLRQTGSVFKPLVYATALEAGESPCQFISNEKVSFAAYDNWTPRNSDNVYGGEYSMQGALTHSVNVVSVNLIMKIGVDNVIKMARAMGIEQPLPEVPSLALGTGELSLKDMVGAYSCFANGGKRTMPIYIQRIEDRNGQILIDNSTVFPEQAISENTAAMMTYMLKSVVNKGTGRGLRTRFGLRNDIAGKTGTSQAQADGWFIGATPDLVVGAWVGADDQRVHFRSLAQGQGAATALPIVGQFLKQTYKDSEFSYMAKSPFTFPNLNIEEQLDCEEYWVPLSMSEFKEWWNKQKELEEQNQE